MNIRRLAIIPIVACVLVACADSRPSDADPPALPSPPAPVETITETVAQPTSETDDNPPRPTTPTETTTKQAESLDLSPRYTRQNIDSYASGYQDGQVSFASVDGSIECEFRPIEQDAPINRNPSLDWRVSFAQGACRFGTSYAVADTNEQNRAGFAELTTAISHVMPENYTTLQPGTYLDLHTMACFTDAADEIACTKYATNETFRINGAGFSMLSNAQRDDIVTTESGLHQVFSSIGEFRFADGNSMSCFFDTPSSSDFWCQTLSTPGWDDGNNLIHMSVSGNNITVIGTQVGNPGLDYFRGRQLIDAKNSLFDASLAVINEGDRVRFRTATGKEIWVSSSDYGSGV
ncbi:hypothetical protein N24_2852 [Corynebacterium suranareeae]|uniref:Secreted protein n=1 Tax=Corynebacterium suranareeae TaxID=2506452 RepID=A0A169S3Z5_9CORY|nr:hypothetical protein [Corynebacterium suranareeae]BAU97114.1 hypothetical protein N24_2852 [Corynebacterium suranareeae]